MHCPDCNTEYKCPCPSCKDKPDGLITWGQLEDKDYEYCIGCGIVRNINEWFEISMDQYLEKKNASQKKIR